METRRGKELARRELKEPQSDHPSETNVVCLGSSNSRALEKGSRREKSCTTCLDEPAAVSQGVSEDPLPTNVVVLHKERLIEEVAEEILEDNTEQGMAISEGDVEEGEDAIRRKQKLDFMTTISSLKLKPHHLSQQKIPLCRFVPMPMVQPTLGCDITKLEQDFAQGYEEGARVFYVSTSDEDGNSRLFSDAEKAQWGPMWNIVNNEFNIYLSKILELMHLVDAKFYVCDGNHRCIAWMRHIKRLYSTNLKWHISVDSIILDTKGRVGVAMQVMHDINKHTEHSHIKTNLMHTLYRVKKYGSMPIDKFNELLSVEDMKACHQNTRKTWYSMPLDVFTSFIFQQEISAATNLGVRKYHEETPVEDVTIVGVATAMRVATKEMTDKLYKKLSKIVSVAHPALGDEWLQEIERHWSLYSVLELTLDKLQLIATANASARHKVKWLKWLNSSGPTREARRFPPRPANDDKLNSFLCKACWYARIEDSAVELYESILRSNNISINMEVTEEPQTLVDFIESWRMKLWDHAFVGVFKGADSFKKSDAFKDFKGSLLVVRRILYRYFMFELYAKKAISKANLPLFLNTWFNHAMLESYMFSPVQLKNWPSAHLQAMPWYLECSQGFIPPHELALFQSIKESATMVSMVDEFAGLDGEARAKAIKRRELADKKKEEKWEEARKKTEDNDAKKEQEAEKAKTDGKGKQKGRKRKAETVVSDPTVSDATMKDTSSGFSLTQQRLLHGPLPHAPNLQGVPPVDECILNVSITTLLDSEEGSVPDAFNAMMAFLEKHASDKDRYLDGVLTKQALVDLIIVDVPKGLSVPTMSIPPAAILVWNQFFEDGLQAVFDLAENYLHDGRALLVMYPLSRKMQSYLKGFYVDFGVKALKEWWGMNRLHLKSPMDLLATATIGEVPSKFSFQEVPAHDAIGVSVARDDVLQNFCNKEDVTMNGKTSWRGPREKA